MPLSGKSLDLAYLAGEGERVLGVELVEDAVRAFFEENGLVAQVAETVPAGKRYEGGGIGLWAADFFGLPKKALLPFDWIYDRAALIALPTPLREKYAERITELLRPGQPMLLVTLEHDPSLGGPPFHVDSAEVARLYGPSFTITELDRVPTEPDNPRYQQAGLTALTEVVYRLVKLG